MKIDKKVTHWVRQGIISGEQGAKIIELEQTAGKARWMHIGLYAFLILGSVVLSIGIISLIAANWEFIPAGLKLAVAFGALAGLGAAVYWSQVLGRDIAHDVFASLFALWCLATLGLIAQVFHTGGEALHAIAFWLVIVLPISYLGKGMFLPALWVLGALIAFYMWALDRNSLWWEYFIYNDSDNITPLFVITAMAMVFFASLCERSESLVRFARLFWFWAVTACLVTLVAGDIVISNQVWVAKGTMRPVYGLLPLAVIALAMRRDTRRTENALLGALLGISVLIYLPSFIFPGSHQSRYEFHEVAESLGALYFVVGSALLAFYFAVRGRLWLFHIMIIAIGVRFLIIYLTVFRDLAFTGIGLVISGLIIIALAMAWYRHRSKLEAWARGVVG